MRRRHYWLLIPVLLGVVLASGLGPLHAQQNDGIILQLAVPGYMADLFEQGVLDQFEAEHPGVTVRLVTDGSGRGMVIQVGSSAGRGDIKDALDAMAENAASADVLTISSGNVAPEITRAGYLLDLAPLVNTDPALDSADFYRAVWESFQWDGGVWALPVAADAVLLFYDRAAFDAAGLPYPDTWQSITDAENAIRALTGLNADGTVAAQGFANFSGDTALLLWALAGTGVYDDSVLPGVPRFDDPALETVLTAWAGMSRDGLFDMPAGDPIDPFAAPLRLGRTGLGGGIRVNGGDSEPPTPALLPGGRAGLTVEGFAVSAGTQYPELAYELAKFLTASPQVAASFFGSTPARRSLFGAESDSGFTFEGGSTPELDALLPAALENGISPAEARFSEYLDQAVEMMVSDGVDARTALDELELTALDRLAAASARAGTDSITVTTPLPDTLPPGEIALKFGISTFISPLPNQEQWDALAADFAAADPEVGRVDLEADLGESLEDMAERYDCFYASNNLVPDADLSLLRSLDPLLSSDPAFDPNDVVGSALAQVQRDGQTWALPVMLQPLAMRYNPEAFSRAGAIPPVNGWTVGDFENALRALKVAPDDPAPFKPQTFNNSHLLMLIAAYGGLPLDYRTDPVTIHFTDPGTVDAIRQVLDLAKAGYIEYNELATRGGALSIALNAEEERVIYTETVNGFGIGGGGGVVVFTGSSGGGGALQLPENTDLLTTFPQGTTYIPVSYEISAAYISAKTPYADACYRFISALARQPELIQGMPARRSMIDDPAVVAAHGAEAVAFYHAIDAQMTRPNPVIIPQASGFGAVSGMLSSLWLNRAFDRYVKEDADLDTELAQAEVYTRGFMDCAAGIAPYTMTPDDFRRYVQQVRECAVQVDPTAADFVGF